MLDVQIAAHASIGERNEPWAGREPLSGSSRRRRLLRKGAFHSEHLKMSPSMVLSENMGVQNAWRPCEYRQKTEMSLGDGLYVQAMRNQGRLFNRRGMWLGLCLVEIVPRQCGRSS